MKANLRYQNGHLYQEHGSWYVRYRQRTSQENGSSRVKHLSKQLGRSKDFSNIFEVERVSFPYVPNICDDQPH